MQNFIILHEYRLSVFQFTATAKRFISSLVCFEPVDEAGAHANPIRLQG